MCMCVGKSFAVYLLEVCLLSITQVWYATRQQQSILPEKEKEKEKNKKQKQSADGNQMEICIPLSQHPLTFRARVFMETCSPQMFKHKVNPLKVIFRLVSVTF